MVENQQKTLKITQIDLFINLFENTNRLVFRDLIRLLPCLTRRSISLIGNYKLSVGSESDFLISFIILMILYNRRFTEF